MRGPRFARPSSPVTSASSGRRFGWVSRAAPPSGSWGASHPSRDEPGGHRVRRLRTGCFGRTTVKLAFIPGSFGGKADRLVELEAGEQASGIALKLMVTAGPDMARLRDGHGGYWSEGGTPIHKDKNARFVALVSTAMWDGSTINGFENAPSNSLSVPGKASPQFVPQYSTALLEDFCASPGQVFLLVRRQPSWCSRCSKKCNSEAKMLRLPAGRRQNSDR
jgi:hypothetical protein